MGTEVITPAPEALVSPQLAVGVIEIEAQPEMAAAATIKPSDLPCDTSNADQLAMHSALARVRDLAPRYRRTKEENQKVRIEMGHALYVLQQLHAKPGWGTFVDRVKAMRSELGFSTSTAYVLIREYEIATGKRRKEDKKPPKTAGASSLSEARKDEGPQTGKDFTITADPTLSLSLSAPPPLPQPDKTESKTKVEIQVPASQLEEWDEAIMVLQKRPGYDLASQSELVIDAVLWTADLARLQQEQQGEEGIPTEAQEVTSCV